MIICRLGTLVVKTMSWKPKISVDISVDQPNYISIVMSYLELLTPLVYIALALISHIQRTIEN